MKTCKGLANFPYIYQPDDYQNKGDLKYKTGLIVSAEDAAPMIEELDKVFEDYYEEQLKLAQVKKPKLKALPVGGRGFRPHTDSETGEETGNIIFNFSQSPEIRGKNGPICKKPKVWDAATPPKATKVSFSSGSLIRVVGDTNCYVSKGEVCMSFRLAAVQVIKPVEYAGNGDSTGGGSSEFDGVEDGFIDDGTSTPVEEIEESTPIEDNGASDF